MRVFCLVGLGVTMPDGSDTEVVWVFNPYIVKQLGDGNINLWAGIQLYNGQAGGNGVHALGFAGNTDNIHFSIPVGFQFSL